MQTAELIRYIKNPQLLDHDSVGKLQKLVDEFPYFQSAHVLLSIASKKWDASVYQHTLKKTAIVVPNRAHLFNLIHREESTGFVEEEIAPIKKAPTSEEKREDIKQELEILKATEIAAEQTTQAEVKPQPEKPGTPQQVSVDLESNVRETEAEKSIELEIGKQVVNSFVEKEILKTHELHQAKEQKEEPASFTDWLSLLKKNNGQTVTQITEQLNKERLKQADSKQQENKEQEPESTKEQQAEPAQQTTPTENNSRKQKNKALIDKIIEKNPGLIRTREEHKFFTPEVKAKESLLNNEHLVTETLARIYALQGNVNKAVRAYEILSLKFPQKSAYFATLIEKLKNNQ